MIPPEGADAEEIELDRQIGLRGSFHDFIVLAWPWVCPGETFIDNWHIREICHALEQNFLDNPAYRKLIINVPPGSMKSLIVQVFWPVWCWIRRPGWRHIGASFSDSVVLRDAEKSLNLIQTEWFQARWGSQFLMPRRVPAVGFYKNSAGGWRFSATVRGPVTGQHCDVFVIDDPQNPTGAVAGKQELEQAKVWFRKTVPTRFRDKKKRRIVIIMQRLHFDDLVGSILESKEPGWRLLVFPTRFNPKIACPEDPRTEEGELIWPEREDESAILELEISLGPVDAAAQLGQLPVPESGNIFLKDWIEPNYYQELPCSIKSFDVLIISFDCAFKNTSTTDWVCGQVWGLQDSHCYWLDTFHRRASFVETVQALLTLNAEYPTAQCILVEDKANGSAVMNVLEETVPNLKPVEPEGGKEARAHAVSGMYQSGHVHYPDPKKNPKVFQHIQELLRFPFDKHDDSVDAATQALLYLKLQVSNYSEAMRKLQSGALGFFFRTGR